MSFVEPTLADQQLLRVEAMWEEGAYRVEAAPAEETDVRVNALLSDEVALEPYPFAADRLEVTWTVRIVPNCAYSSQGEFLEDFFRAPQVQRRRTSLSAPGASAVARESSE